MPLKPAYLSAHANMTQKAVAFEYAVYIFIQLRYSEPVAVIKQVSSPPPPQATSPRTITSTKMLAIIFFIFFSPLIFKKIINKFEPVFRHNKNGCIPFKDTAESDNSSKVIKKSYPKGHLQIFS